MRKHAVKSFTLSGVSLETSSNITRRMSQQGSGEQVFNVPPFMVLGIFPNT